MQISRLPRLLCRAARLIRTELSTAALTRLQALEVWHATGDWRLGARIFGLSRATLFRWRRRYQPAALWSLEAHSRRPHRVRQPQTSAGVIRRVHHLRQQYPRWGREKLRVLLRREGIQLSAKTMDRILARLRTQGQLIEPPRQAISARRRRPVRP